MRRGADVVDTKAKNLGRIQAVCSTRLIGGAIAYDIHAAAESRTPDKVARDVAPIRQDNPGLVMAACKIASAMAAGNAVVLKPSELTPFSTARLAELAIQAGVPAGIFDVVQGTEGGPATRRCAIRAAARARNRCSPASPTSTPRGRDRARHHRQCRPGLCGGARRIVQRQVADQVIERIGKTFTALGPCTTLEQHGHVAAHHRLPQAERIDRIMRETVAAGGGAHGRHPPRPASRPAAGSVWVNRYGRSADFILPTGGLRSSGIGKDPGRQALKANLCFKTALISFA